LDNPWVSVTFLFLRLTELSAMGCGYLISLTEKESVEKVVEEAKKSI